MSKDTFLKEYGNILYNTERPARYTGGEYGSYNKDFDLAKGRFLFAFPDCLPAHRA